MRKTLEDLYYGNITPNAQDMAPHSELKRATDRVTRFENQLTEQLDETGQTILAKLIESQQEIDSCQRRCDFVVFCRTENVDKWRVKVYSLCIIILAVFVRQA